MPKHKEMQECVRKSAELTNRRRYRALVKAMQMLSAWRVEHVQKDVEQKSIGAYNQVVTLLQHETDYIRLAEGSPESWGLVREIEAVPDIDDLDLLALAKKAEKWIRQRKKEAAKQRPFRQGKGGSAAPKNGHGCKNFKRKNSPKKDGHRQRSSSRDRDWQRDERKCYNCEKTRHFAKNCPHWEDKGN